MQTIFRVSLTVLVAGIASTLWSCSGGDGAPPATQTAVSPCAGSASAAAAGVANISWDPVTAANLSGYRIYFGTAPGKYSQPVGQGLDAGNITAYTASGLTRGTRYYFAVTAYDAAGAESGYSNEICKDVS